MPTTYTHWRFGDLCIKNLPSELSKLVNEHRDIFNYGVHGPDTFFYYNCLKLNDINKFGFKMHKVPFKQTLASIKDNYKNCDDKDSALAYLLGFVCHFTLDSYSHGYIERVEEETVYSHARIESQQDKYYLIKDGYDPIKKSVSFSFKPSAKIAHTMHQLFPSIDEKTMFNTIKDQKKYIDLLKDNSDIKRSFLLKLMDIFHAAKYKDLLITKTEYPGLEPVMLRLDKYFNVALLHYPKLAVSMYSYLTSDRPLDEYFHNHFEPKDDYKKIEVLTLEEEKKYEVGFQD